MIPENFSLHVPKGSGNPLVAALQLIPANHLDAWRMHRVGAGETLATIGKRYGVTPANIVSANRLESAQAVEGDRLLIPAVQRIQTPVAKKPLSAAARRRSARTTTAAARKSPVVVAHNTGN
jgi:membrane-bound lytic murein transglycosylase D